jgi:polysaccharide biosynthesis transport protein
MAESNYNDVPESPSGGMNLGDIYFILFRRKWLIILFALLGIAAAGVLFKLHKPIYRSDSKLLVRYVVEDKPLMPGDNAQIRAPDSEGTTIINSEIQILTSLDLLVQVAEAIGPAKIIGNGAGEVSKFAAGSAIAESLKVEVPPRSDIIKITFRHLDPTVVKPVLDRLIEEYLTRHAEIHRGLGSLDDLLSQHADQLRSRLNTTDEELRKLKADAGVISLDETKLAIIQEMSDLRRELNNTEAALAEARAASLRNTNIVASTNGVQASVEIPIDIITQYRATMARVMAAREHEFMLRAQFSDANPLVKRARDLVAEQEQQRNSWEAQYPGLLKLPTSAVPSVAAGPLDILLQGDPTRLTALEAKAQTLKSQLESVRLEVSKLDEIEGRLKQLQRKRDLDETNYRYFATGLDRSRFDQQLGLTRNNISVVQSPTPATKDASKLLKLLGAAVGGGIGFGLVLAFLLEMFVDQSVRQVHDVERRLQLPLFMSVPYVNGKTMRNFAKTRRLSSGGPGRGNEVSDPVMSCPPDHPLRPIFESLRDRTLLHFKNVDHKPKLIGVASCSIGAGGTTFAAGLAATLSETGEGKVLLVDMNQPNRAAHPFFRGKPTAEISDVLEEDKRDAAMVQTNLYVAKANGHERKISALAKQLSTLVPRFKASDSSDYDFIIFDLPRVTPTSVSVRLGAMMDLVLLFAESEKVPRQALKQAYSLVADTGVDTQLVLNKVRSYVPARLSGEL